MTFIRETVQNIVNYCTVELAKKKKKIAKSHIWKQPLSYPAVETTHEDLEIKFKFKSFCKKIFHGFFLPEIM